MRFSVAHHTSLGLEPGGPAWYQLVARSKGCLPPPALTEAPLAFQAPQRPACRRKAGAKVLPQI